MFASGHDDLFAVRLNTEGVTARGMIADTSGILGDFMQTMGFDVPAYHKGTPEGDYLLVGAYKPQQWGSGISDIMEWVYKGHTLIIVDNPEEWANFLSDKEVLDYRGSKVLGKAWYGGNFSTAAIVCLTDFPRTVYSIGNTSVSLPMTAGELACDV